MTVRQLRAECIEHRIPFLFKQWGEWSPADLELSRPLQVGSDIYASQMETYELEGMRRVGKKNAGRELDGRTWDEFPEATS